MLLTALIVREGATKVVAAVAAASWALPVVVAVTLTRFFSDGGAWLALVPKSSRPRFRAAVWIRWLGGSVNDLLPSARLGGDILTARLATICCGLPASLALAVALVNMTISVSMRILVTVGGLILLIAVSGREHLYAPTLLVGSVALLIVAAFFGLQRLGLFQFSTGLIARFGSSARWQSLPQAGARLDDTLRTLYARPWALATCGGLWLFSWLVGCVATWIGLYALGIHTSFTVAMIIETVGQGVRSVLFIVPAGLGVFEGGMVVICNWLAIPGDTALGLSLIHRAREVVFSGSGLIVWQFVEARRLLRREEQNFISRQADSAEATSAKDAKTQS